MGFIDKNGRVSINAVILAVIILIAGVGGTVFYYSQLVSAKDSQIASLNAQIQDLQGQVSNLNLPNLVTALSIGVQKNTNISVNGVEMSGNVLYITGSITNQGKTAAQNVEINVVATDVYGSKVIDMTVPIWGNYVVGEDPNLVSNTAGPTTIDPIQTANYVNIRILCQSEPAAWHITPVYSN